MNLVNSYYLSIQLLIYLAILKFIITLLVHKANNSDNHD